MDTTTTHRHPPPPQQPPCNTTTTTGTTTAETTLLHQSEKTPTNKRYIVLLAINYISLFVGTISSSLLAKFYFIHNGSSRWVSTWVQCAGFPILLIPILVPYLTKFTTRKPFSNCSKQTIITCIAIGLLLGVNNLLFSWGTSYLPVSTSSLLLSTQLLFTLLLSFLIVRQKITFNNLNCVVLLTLSSVLLAVVSSHDRPQGITKGKYFVGYFCTIGAGFLFALYLPLMEKIYRKVSCFEMVMEMQLMMEMAATFLATIGMALDGGFKEMKRESLFDFDLGKKLYWITVVTNVLSWQLCFMGTAGMVFLTTSLTSGVCMTALLAMNVFAGVIVYGDHFGGPKAVSTALCIWGFSSYLYGKYVTITSDSKKRGNLDFEDEKDGEIGMNQIVTAG